MTTTKIRTGLYIVSFLTFFYCLGYSYSRSKHNKCYKDIPIGGNYGEGSNRGFHAENGGSMFTGYNHHPFSSYSNKCWYIKMTDGCVGVTKLKRTKSNKYKIYPVRWLNYKHGEK